MSQENNHNGWKNYETWNVVLWINNNESFYDFAKSCKRAKDPYAHFGQEMKEMECFQTPDGVAWNDPSLDFEALNEMIGEL